MSRNEAVCCSGRVERTIHWRTEAGMPRSRRDLLMRGFQTLVRFVGSALVASATVAALTAAPVAAAGQDQPGCQPDQAATKYPSLAGKTIKIAADPAIQPYVFRDPADFEHLIGVDADLIPQVMSCVGVKYEYSLGAWGGLLPSVVAGQAEMM